MTDTPSQKAAAVKRSCLFYFLVAGLASSLGGCAITATRPIQELSNTAAAIRAAKEVRADILAPEIYRQAREWYAKARRENKFKNFKEARIYTRKARLYAEEAELEALKNGGQRVEAPIEQLDDLPEPEPSPTDDTPPPTGVFYESAEQELKNQAKTPPSSDDSK